MNPPNGFSRISPYIFVENASEFILFLKNAFGANEIGRTLRGEHVANAQMDIQGSSFMVADAIEAFGPMPVAHYLYVDDVEEAMIVAEAAGARKLFEPVDMPYGDRQGGVQDPFGNIWWVSQRLTDSPYYE